MEATFSIFMGKSVEKEGISDPSRLKKTFSGELPCF